MSDLPYQSPISISHIDLPIISCHSGRAISLGKGKLKEFFVGSVCSHCLHHCGVPLVVPTIHLE